MPSQFANKIAAAHRPERLKDKVPLWHGPSAPGPMGGVTQSMLGRFLSCRERFRLYAVEGLRSGDRFNHRTGYGDMWHVCEEHFANEVQNSVNRGGCEWMAALELHCRTILQKYPSQQEDIEHWYMVCKLQFPEYVKFWQNHPDVVDRSPLLSEEVFDCEYYLPSKRMVRLRGKWDSVDLVGKGNKSEIWLMENKTKGDIDEPTIRRQLTFDLQTMIYLVALRDYHRKQLPPWPDAPVVGVRYNVIRRPLSGGKGTIQQKQPTDGSKCPKCKTARVVPEKKGSTVMITCPKCFGRGRINAQPGETREHYYERVTEYIRKEPETYFMRWNTEVSDYDVEKFKHEFLDPQLEQLCDWWEWVSAMPSDPFANKVHFVTPYGYYNTMAEGVVGDYDTYRQSGSTVGLTKVDTLFKELQ